MALSPLPIDEFIPDLCRRLESAGAVVVQAPPGTGKTTRVPPAILDSMSTSNHQVVLIEPRRLAARSAVMRMADEHGSPVGERFGWNVRFDRKGSTSTRLWAVTPGILLQRLIRDPYLDDVGCLVFDEFHERGLETDALLGFARLIQQNIRPDLKIVVMSATMECGPVSAYLGGAPIISATARSFPVDVTYEPLRDGEHPSTAVARLVERQRGGNDVLVFLPGLGEIRRTRELLLAGGRSDTEVLPLHGELPLEEQARALRIGPAQRIVLSTNVAETSVTVEGVRTVIDTGTARQLTFDPGTGMDRLRLIPIARDSADQRAGRAGRTGPGSCVRLWSAGSHTARPAETEPEIRRVDLAPMYLRISASGEMPERFPWFTPPSDAAFAAARELLVRLDALDDSGVTPLGRELARLPVHPRIARLLIEAKRTGVVRSGAGIAAVLSEKDLFARGRPSSVISESDVMDRLEKVERFDQGAAGRVGTVDHAALRTVIKVRDQLLGLLNAGDVDRIEGDRDRMVTRCLSSAFPDRVCRRRAAGSDRGVMVGGRGVKLSPDSAVRSAPLFLALDVDAGGAESVVRLAAEVRTEDLPASAFRRDDRVEFDSETERVQAHRVECFHDLELDRRPVKLPTDGRVESLLRTEAMLRWDRVRPETGSAAELLLRRWRFLVETLPDADLPDPNREWLQDCLDSLLPGCRSFADLRGADWCGAMLGRLTNARRQFLDREAPERVEVPGGSKIAVQYESGRPPILAVRIQELFGLAETPRIAGGRVKLLLHLLAPNYRPQQITDDLASFWRHTYSQVRKDLRARYPKHSWPEDPLTAEPERRPKRRGG